VAADLERRDVGMMAHVGVACRGLLWGVVGLIVFGSSLLLLRSVAPPLPEGAGGAGQAVSWGVLGLLAVALACPWLAASRAPASVTRSPTWAALVGAVGYVAAGILSLAHLRDGWPSREALLVLLVAAPGIQAMVFAARVRHWRLGAMLLLALVAAVLAVRAPWARPGAWAAREEWLMVLASPWLSAAVVALMLPAALCLLFWVCQVRRRAAWTGVLIVGLASFPTAWLGMKALRPEADEAGRWPSRPSPVGRLPEEWAVAEPAGIFRETTSEAVLGWRWANVGRDEWWREALLLKVPCDLTAKTILPADGRLRLLVALPRQFRTEAHSGRVRCTVTANVGSRPARYSALLDTDDTKTGADVWHEVILEIPGAGGSEASVTLKATPDDAQEALGDGPILAVATRRVPARAANSPSGPNCLIILVDALRADRLHCYGYPLATSPHIDRIAAEGLLFERVRNSCSWTLPAVASLFTGTYVSTHKMAGFRLPAHLSLPTLAEQFREAGIRTAAVSSNAFIVPDSGFGVGFDEFVFPERFCHEIGGDEPADWVTDRSIALLRRFKGQRSFIYLHYMDPHKPYGPPPGWTQYGHTEEQRYVGEIRYCDNEIGRLLDELDTLGLARDTLVVFIGGHGEAFFDHGHNKHGDTLHHAYATMVDLMGLPVAGHVEGEPLLPLAVGPQGGTARLAFSELHEVPGMAVEGTWVSVESERYKLILHLTDGERRLYDVQRDPDEQIDVAARKPDVADSLERAIRDFLSERGSVRAAQRPITAAERRRLVDRGHLEPEVKPMKGARD